MDVVKRFNIFWHQFTWNVQEKGFMPVQINKLIISSLLEKWNLLRSYSNFNFYQKLKMAQSALSPFVQIELGVLRKFEVANPINQSAKFLPGNPREDEDVHPDFQRQHINDHPTFHHLLVICFRCLFLKNLVENILNLTNRKNIYC